jgi:polyphosphate kinase 2 (PPK2 family)
MLVRMPVSRDKLAMPVRGALERYQIKPGAKLDLGKIDSSEKTLFQASGKEEGESQLLELRGQLQQLQKRLYAENKQRILVVIQAMDTGGKDGCINNVFSGIDPHSRNRLRMNWLTIFYGESTPRFHRPGNW